MNASTNPPRGNTTDHQQGKALEASARNVLPGEWKIEHQRPLATLLGSCVSVCFFDPKLRFGGMNHFMLPSRAREPVSETDSTLVGDYAMEALLNAMLARGAQKQRIVAKAFGGGSVVSGLINTGIGERNVRFAKEWLQREQISLVSADLLGPWSRKIVLDPQNGEVFCRRIGRNEGQSRQIAQEEEAYRETLEQARLRTLQNNDNVELF